MEIIIMAKMFRSRLRNRRIKSEHTNPIVAANFFGGPN